MDLDALKDRLRLDEGLRLKPYGDLKSKITIGYGRNLTDGGISQEEAEALLDRDVEIAIATVRGSWQSFDRLDDVRQQVVVNMVFNLGIVGFLNFKHTIAAMAQGNYAEAARGMRASLWAKQVGARAERLTVAMETGAFLL